jgi:bifunctional non-homologous end joining protein LigD
MTKSPQRLNSYRAKRRFDRTPEPSGGAVSSDEPIFVVQKHAATRLHYDLRLQVGDTLRSWAVPEGPSLDPKVRRFAKQVEDHPIDYAAFEGRIPEGEYGAGTVIVWDRGTWTSVSEPVDALERGELKFRLTGEKLGGGWMLKRLPDDPTNWLLIKERDTAARPSADYDVVVDAPDSVVTGAAVADLPPATKSRKLAPPKASKIKGAAAAKMPQEWKPQLAGTENVVPAGPGWVHEIKYDGYRTVCLFDRGEVRLLTRNGHDWTSRYGGVAKALTALPCKTAVIDGEIVVQDPRGVTRLALLEQALAAGQAEAFVFFAFDLCYLDGFDLTRVPLLERKSALERLINPLVHPKSTIQYSQHVASDGAALFARACEMGLEGIISKKADSRYVQARSNDWLKLKRAEIDDFVIIGFLANAPKAVTSLILAEEKNGKLSYAGKSGSGISEAFARELYQALNPNQIDEPATDIPSDAGSKWSKTPLAGARWVAPNWIATIGHRGRTESGAIRHAVLFKFARRKPAGASRSLKRKLVTDRDLAAIRLTNPDREMFTGSGVSKLDIALHYARVGDWMLPDLLRRPVTLVRCPTGEHKDCFYQRHAFTGLPEGVEQIDLSDEEGRAAFISIVEPKGFLALSQFGAVEFHAWGCHIDDPDHADRLVIDLDPAPDVSWRQVCDAAEILKDRLERLGFAPFLRTTGGKGLHIMMALAKGQRWETVKGFAQAFAKSAAREAPQLFTAVSAKAKRTGRIYIDYLRNARGATAVASYSLRARDRFPVATPIAWSELRGLSGGDAFTVKNIVQRLESIRADPWDELGLQSTKITARMARDVGMAS